MAIAIDASTPVRWTGTPADNVDITSASFTAPSGAMLVLCVSADQDNAVGTTTTLSVADSGTLSWTERVHRDDADTSAEEGVASIWTAVTASATSRTISVRRTNINGGTNRISAKCYVVTGADTSGIGASGEGSSATNDLTASIFTSTAANSFAFVAGTEWNQLGSPTSSDLTADAGDYAGEISCVSGYKDCGTTGAETANLNAGGSGAAQWNWAAVEIKPSAATTKAPPPTLFSRRTRFFRRNG